MVLAFIAQHWLAKAVGSGAAVVGVHIDYGNRAESAAEAGYVEWWCGQVGIGFCKRVIDEVKRGLVEPLCRLPLAFTKPAALSCCIVLTPA